MLAVITTLLLILKSIESSEIDGHVVQFVVYARQSSDITHLFPGATVQSTWNNVYLVRIWTHDPGGLISEIQTTLEKNTAILETVIAPFTLEAATQKWIEYNAVWAMMLITIFITGCACGAVVIDQCMHGRPRRSLRT